MNRSAALADVVLAFHACIAVAVFGGLVFAIVGQILGWRWTRSYKWRVPHLIVTVYLCLRATLGSPCPLSRWEDSLRPTTSVAAEQPAATSLQHALRFLAFRDVGASPFRRAMTAFTAITIIFFLRRIASSGSAFEIHRTRPETKPVQRGQ